MKGNDKKLIIIAGPPIFLILFLIIYMGTKKEDTIENIDTDYTDIEVTDTVENLKSKTSIYDRKYRELDKKSLDSKMDKDADFFESWTETKSEDPEEKTIEEDPEPVAEKKEEKKEIVRYIEKPVKKEKIEEEVKEPEKTKRRDNAFFSADVEKANEKADNNTLSAVIHNDQEIKSGGKVSMRLTQEAILNGITFPKNTFIHGVASFSNERVLIKVKGIEYRSRIITTNLSVFDNDGQEGIYIPGGFENEVAEDVTIDAINEVGNNINIPILGNAPDIAKKKARESSVILKSGHKILLK